eukprot:s2573_g3.t1
MRKKLLRKMWLEESLRVAEYSLQESVHRLCENAKGPEWLKDALSEEVVVLTRWAARKNKEWLEQAVGGLSRSNLAALCKAFDSDQLQVGSKTKMKEMRDGLGSRLPIAVQPGMAFREKLHDDHPDWADDNAVFMCLVCLKWGLLVWQLTPQSMETWALDTSKQIQWKFLIGFADHEAAEAIPAFDHELGIEVKLGSWEPLVKTTLRLHSSKLTVQDLCVLATIGFNIPEKEAQACTKVQLVKALALKVADEDFAEIVCQSLSQPKKPEDDDDTGEPDCDELGKMLLEMLEPSDLSEFMGLKKGVQRKQQSQKNRQWKNWQQEAEDEFRLNLV